MKRWIAVAVAFAAVAAFWLTASGQTTNEWVVESGGDAGHGTLRWAIEAANASSGDDVIRFASPMTIRPRSPLPPLTDAGITIDGSGGDVSVDMRPRVWLEGAAAGDSAGLELSAARGVVKRARDQRISALWHWGHRRGGDRGADRGQLDRDACRWNSVCESPERRRRDWRRSRGTDHQQPDWRQWGSAANWSRDCDWRRRQR